jgi:cytosine/adenosine deaminase-related metal-dependent hydrolase
MHMLETRCQRLYAYRTWGTSFVEHLDAIGALGDWLTLAHMVWVDDGDLPLLNERHVGVAHNPSSNLRLHSGIAPLHAFLRAGIAVGVGLDGHALDDDQDYWRELRLAGTLANYRAGVDADQTVRAADLLLVCARHSAAITFGAAPLPAGGFRVGDLADLVLVDWTALCGGWTPDGYPAPDEGPSFLLRHASRDQVRHVMIGGEWRLRDGQAVGIDERALAAEIRAVLAAQDWDALRARRAAAAQLAAHIRRFYAAWDG